MMKNVIMLAGLCIVALVSAEVRPLKIGQSIPESVLTTVEAKPFNLKMAAEQQPLVVIFYRGGWCPYCNLHLGRLQEVVPELEELGYRIVAISPDLPAKLLESVDKIELTYTLLSDASMETAEAFGLAFTVDDATLEKYKGYGIDLEAASGQKHHRLPVPAVFIVGTDSVIDFVYANPDYKTRLDPEVLLAAAKAAFNRK